MQVANPLGINLRIETKAGEEYLEKRDVRDFHFINERGGRGHATVDFARILRKLYNHPDWSQIYSFCTKRYSKTGSSNTQLLPTLTSRREEGSSTQEQITVGFNTDPTAIGLPRDLIDNIAGATKKAIGGFIGPDPVYCAIGPALSCAIGPGAYMDLIYEGNPPGTTPVKSTTGSNSGSSSTTTMLSSVQTEKKGGRGRSAAEWRDLWAVLGDWIYENEVTSLEHFHGAFSFKPQYSHEDLTRLPSAQWVSRKYFETHAIHGADAIQDMFSQLAENPLKFQGIEWDFLALEADPEVERDFLKRFGPKPADDKMRPDLSRDVWPEFYFWHTLGKSDTRPQLLRPCPDSFRGIDWENWLLSIEGGSIVTVTTVFQVCISLLSSVTVLASELK